MTTQLQPTAPIQHIDATPAACPKLTALKAHAKALKKRRKQEQRRFFIAVCNSFHALGFSF
ncbi:hypothetical protein A0257_00930 [Hymenobacter psoromatis]|nr:hypothetical protein A0257_00930 [Hymenobacter psoromatis]